MPIYEGCPMNNQEILQSKRKEKFDEAMLDIEVEKSNKQGVNVSEDEQVFFNKNTNILNEEIQQPQKEIIDIQKDEILEQKEIVEEKVEEKKPPPPTKQEIE